MTEFDGSAWYAAAKSSVSWDSVSWSDVSWSDVSWTDVSWSDVSWSDVSWSDVSWSDVLAAADVSWEDNAEAEVGNPEGDYFTTPKDEALAGGLGLAKRLGRADSVGTKIPSRGGQRGSPGSPFLGKTPTASRR